MVRPTCAINDSHFNIVIQQARTFRFINPLQLQTRPHTINYCTSLSRQLGILMRADAKEGCRLPQDMSKFDQFGMLFFQTLFTLQQMRHTLFIPCRRFVQNIKFMCRRCCYEFGFCKLSNSNPRNINLPFQKSLTSMKSQA